LVPVLPIKTALQPIFTAFRAVIIVAEGYIPEEVTVIFIRPTVRYCSEITRIRRIPLIYVTFGSFEHGRSMVVPDSRLHSRTDMDGMPGGVGQLQKKGTVGMAVILAGVIGLKLES